MTMRILFGLVVTLLAASAAPAAPQAAAAPAPRPRPDRTPCRGP